MNTLILPEIVGVGIFAAVFVALHLRYRAIIRRKDKTLARLAKENANIEEKIRRLRIENDKRSESRDRLRTMPNSE